jgi:hypothetical protein
VDHSRIHRGSVSPDNLLSLAGVGHRHSVRFVCLSICLFVCRDVSSVFLFVYSHPKVDHPWVHSVFVGPDNLLSLAGVGHCHSVRFVCLSVFLSVSLYILSVFMFVYLNHKVDHPQIHLGSIGPYNLLSLAGVGHHH